ncbi:MAG: hypothetical protein ACJAQ6_001370 [Arenicella sp.]|jgi:hypothetical protein
MVKVVINLKDNTVGFNNVPTRRATQVSEDLKAFTNIQLV